MQLYTVQERQQQRKHSPSTTTYYLFQKRVRGSHQVSEREKHFENTNFPNQSRCKAPPHWLRTTMGSNSSVVAIGENRGPFLHLTPCTLQVVREFFCIEHSSRGTILCRLASRASSLGWRVGNNQWKIENSGN